MKKIPEINRILMLSLLVFFALFSGITLARSVRQGTGTEERYSPIRHISGKIAHFTLGTGNTVRLTYWGESDEGYPDFGSGKIAEDGTFVIKSLKVVPDDMLKVISGMPPGISVSDPSARIFGGCTLRLYPPKAAKPGKTIYRGRRKTDEPVGVYFINFTYSDRPTTVRGSDPHTASVWNVRLEKGWNRIAQIVTHLDPMVIEFTDIEPENGGWFLY